MKYYTTFIKTFNIVHLVGCGHSAERPRRGPDVERDRVARVDLLLEEFHSDLMLLAGLDLVGVGVPESYILTIYKNYQLQTGGDLIVYLGKGDFLITCDSGCYTSSLRYKVYLLN